MTPLAKYKRWVGQTVYFNKRSRRGREMISRGFHSGVIANVIRTRAGILYEVSFGVPVRDKISHFRRNAFVFEPPVDQPQCEIVNSQNATKS